MLSNCACALCTHHVPCVLCAVRSVRFVSSVSIMSFLERHKPTSGQRKSPRVLSQNVRVCSCVYVCVCARACVPSLPCAVAESMALCVCVCVQASSFNPPLSLMSVTIWRFFVRFFPIFAVARARSGPPQFRVSVYLCVCACVWTRAKEKKERRESG